MPQGLLRSRDPSMTPGRLSPDERPPDAPARQSSPRRQPLTQCLQKDPNEQNALVMMRFCLAHMGEHQRALFYARKAAGLFPDNADIQTNLGGSYASLGDRDQASKAAACFVGSTPARPGMLALATILLGHPPIPRRLRACAKGGMHSGTIGFAMYAATSLIAMGRADRSGARPALSPAAFPANYEAHDHRPSLGSMYAADVDPESRRLPQDWAGCFANMAPGEGPFANSPRPDAPPRRSLLRRHAPARHGSSSTAVRLYDRSKMR